MDSGKLRRVVSPDRARSSTQAVMMIVHESPSPSFKRTEITGLIRRYLAYRLRAVPGISKESKEKCLIEV